MSSIKDVAREAGVSTATVSHVINNTRFVSEEVRARVQTAIEQCRYYPNLHARSLASGNSRILGKQVAGSYIEGARVALTHSGAGNTANLIG